MIALIFGDGLSVMNKFRAYHIFRGDGCTNLGQATNINAFPFMTIFQSQCSKTFRWENSVVLALGFPECLQQLWLGSRECQSQPSYCNQKNSSPDAPK